MNPPVETIFDRVSERILHQGRPAGLDLLADEVDDLCLAGAFGTVQPLFALAEGRLKDETLPSSVFLILLILTRPWANSHFQEGWVRLDNALRDQRGLCLSAPETLRVPPAT